MIMIMIFRSVRRLVEQRNQLGEREMLFQDLMKGENTSMMISCDDFDH